MFSSIKNYIFERKWILSRFLSKMYFIDDKTFLKIKYRLSFGKKLNIEKPQTFSEKINWLKLYDRKPEYNMMADKYAVRNYIKEKIGEEHLIPLLGVWESFDDINFDELPEQFVLKCTHDTASVIVCKSKTDFDKNAARQKITKKLKTNLFWFGREWVYKDIKPRIIAEKYMEDSNSKELRDYKFYCFNGVPHYIYVSRNLSNHALGQISFYDMNFEPAPFGRTDFKPISDKIMPPINLKLMEEYAKILSSGHRFLRVDFYEVDGKIYFGELTFYPTAGYMHFDPEEWDKKLGDLIVL